MLEDSVGIAAPHHVLAPGDGVGHLGVLGGTTLRVGAMNHRRESVEIGAVVERIIFPLIELISTLVVTVHSREIQSRIGGPLGGNIVAQISRNAKNLGGTRCESSAVHRTLKVGTRQLSRHNRRRRHDRHIGVTHLVGSGYGGSIIAASSDERQRHKPPRPIFQPFCHYPIFNIHFYPLPLTPHLLPLTSLFQCNFSPKCLNPVGDFRTPHTHVVRLDGEVEAVVFARLQTDWLNRERLTVDCG